MIDVVSKQVDDGCLTVEGSNDVLTQALGTSEHGGRVRGVGFGITPTEYFHKPHPSDEALQNALKQVDNLTSYVLALATAIKKMGGEIPEPCPSISQHLEKVGSNSAMNSTVGLVSPILFTSTAYPTAEQMGEKGNEKRKRNESNSQVDGTPPRKNLEKSFEENEQKRRKEVNNDPDPPVNPNEKVTSRPCQLALGSIDTIVACGKLQEGGSNVLHGSIIPEGTTRVSILKLLGDQYKKEKLPFSTVGASTLSEAVGSYVAWPRDLVILSDIGAYQKAPKTRQGEFDLVAANILMLVDQALGDDERTTISVGVPHEVFHTDIPCEGHPERVVLCREDLLHVINFKEIGITVVKLYMCALYKKVVEIGLDQQIKFVHPAGTEGNSGQNNTKELFACLYTAKPGQLFLYPYNIGYHWVLVIIDPWRRHGLYLDPLGNDMDGNLLDTMSYAFSLLNLKDKFKSTKKNATIDTAMCPIQCGVVECGYYVLRYMRDVVHSGGIEQEKMFCSCESYERGLIDEVRVEFMNFVRDNM